MENNLKKIIQTKYGFDDVRPTKDTLKKLGMGPRRFTRVFENNGDELTGPEIIKLSKWLNVSTDELLNVQQ